MQRMRTKLLLVAVLSAAAWPGNAWGFVPKPVETPLDQREFFKPELYISTANRPLAEMSGALANATAWNRFFGDYGPAFHVWLDPRSGGPSNILGPLPLLPGNGAGNRLSLADLENRLGRRLASVDPGVVAAVFRRFVEKNADILLVDPAELGAIRVQLAADDLWQISIPRLVGGIPVRHARLAASIKQGNLVTLGTETWGRVDLDTRPGLSADQALAAGWAWLGGSKAGDLVWMKPFLEFVPFAPPAFQTAAGFDGPAGSGYGHLLAWTFGFFREGDQGSWQITLDAHTGEVLEFKDINRYARVKVSGGIYPVTSTDICPDAARCGAMQLDSPMPWADTSLPAPDNYTNSAGLCEASGGTVRTTLAGKFVRITDNCGAISESAASGDLDLGGVNGQHDCTTSGASAGDTPSSRSAFYEVNKLVEMARGWIPANTWLQGQLPTTVNISDTCNAYYSPGAGSINFYRSGGGCRNTGEIAAVFDHEWGHALDDNDTGGALSNTSETYADVAAIYRLQMSCVGYGFWWTSDQGCGMTADGTGYNGDNAQTGGTLCELDCSGVRGADYASHAGGVPDTPANFSCSRCNSGSGPCGREEHCDAMPATEAAWDFAARDLQAAPFNYDSATAFMIANKIFYQGSGNIGNWHACSCPSSSDGCGSTNAYIQWLTADDDNGNLNDGTPHMTALYAAFNRHSIACATPAPVNSGCTGGPGAAPVLSASPANNQVVLNWPAVPGAAKYWVLRAEGFAGCHFGKALVATVTGTGYTDPDVANGRTYSYNVVAVGSSNACFGPASACVQATPQPCAGAVSLDKTLYNCADTIQITLVDSDLAGAGTHPVTVWSAGEPDPETVTLTENPASSGRFSGAIATTSGPAVHGDGQVSAGHGDSVTVRYTDASSCGTPDQEVTQSAPVDCLAPLISGVYADQVTGSQATVHWATDEPGTSVVRYGRTLPPGSTTADGGLVTAHSSRLGLLAECSTYFYQVESVDAAGNGVVDNNGGAYFTFRTTKNVNPAYPSADTPVPIPDNTPAGAASAISVAEANTVLDVNVTVNIAHTYTGDLALSLIAPDGTTVPLATRRGGGQDNFTDTTFDDAASTPISGGTPPFTGTFQPESPLAVLNGREAAGVWTLKAVDNANLDSGTILGWTLTLLYPEEDCGATLRLDAETYRCGGQAGISVKDTTLAGTPSLTVTVVSTSETVPETVLLTAQPAPHEETFLGSIALTSAPPSSGDGTLSLADGDTLTVTYIDADDGQGNFDVPHTAAAAADCGLPLISAVAATAIGSTTATIGWLTQEGADSVVLYGLAIPPDQTASAALLVTSHAVDLAGLAECSTYHYSVQSTDAVGNLALDTNGGQYYSFETLKRSTNSYPSADTPKPIPDNNPAGGTSSIAVSDAGLVQDVNLAVNITHTFDGDIALSLISPQGTTVSLANKRGSSGDNYSNTVFDDQAATPISGGSPPFTGSFRPETPLSALNGESGAGTWQLKVVDNASSDSGTIVNWTLELTFPAGTCGAAAAYHSSSPADSCLGGGGQGGDGIVDRGEDATLAVTLRNSGTVPLAGLTATLSTTLPGVTVTRAQAAFPDVPAGGLAPSLAPHFAFAVAPAVLCGAEIPFSLAIHSAQGEFRDAFTVRVGAPGTAANTYDSTDVPKPIADNSTVVSTLAVSNPDPILDLEVNLTLTHTYDGDLTLTLIAPNGTRVQLANRRGSSGDNYTNTTFDDQAATAIGSGSAPFSGSFRPEQPLSVQNGLAALGTWQLEVKDQAGGDTGSLQSWKLQIRTSSGWVCHDCVLSVPSAEPANQAWLTPREQRWDAVAGASFYNLYRGTATDLPTLATGAPDSCLRLTTTATVSGEVLAENPPPAGLYWYLVRAANPAGEGPAGQGTAGPRSQDSAGPCP